MAATDHQHQTQVLDRLLGESGQEKLLANADVLDLGCGRVKYPRAIGLDIRPTAAADLVADLEAGIPLSDGTFDIVLAVSVLEHLDDLAGAMAEVHRVLRPGGRLIGKVPHWSDRSAHIDPTHSRTFDEETLWQWDPDEARHEYFPETPFRVVQTRRVRRWQFWKDRPILFHLKAVPTNS